MRRETASRAQRALIVGFDGLSPELLLSFRSELPAFDALLARGTFTPAWSCPPVDTPTNWTTIATGAATGTHGITGFQVHLPGEPLDRVTPTFNSRYRRAECLWETAARHGRRAVVLNYPIAWPPPEDAHALGDQLVIVGGDGVSSQQWTVRRATCYATAAAVAAGVTDGTVIALSPANEASVFWRRLPPTHAGARPPLAGRLPLVSGGQRAAFTQAGWTVTRGEDPTELLRSPSYHLLVLDSTGHGYDRVLICQDADSGAPLAALRLGEWSPWLLDTFDGGRRAAFRFKLTALSPDGRKLRLYRTDCVAGYGWAYPPQVGENLLGAVGPYWEHLEHTPGGPNWFGDGGGSDEGLRAQADWLAEAARHLSRSDAADLVFAQVHVPDGLNHRALADLWEGAPDYDPARAARTRETYRRTLGGCDYLLGRLVRECADEHTAVAVVSDHGFCPNYRFVWTDGLLAQRGWLTYAGDPFVPGPDARRADWPRTKVYRTDNNYLWLNVAGRDPDGIVDPGAEYEALRDALIEALYSLRDPATGRCPVALALRKEDAGTLGLTGPAGDRVGDVVYFLQPGYCDMLFADDAAPAYGARGELVGPAVRHRGIHHSYLPHAALGPSSNRAIFLFAGPGIRAGAAPRRPPWLMDVAPTLAYLLGMPPPAQADGKVLHEVLA